MYDRRGVHGPEPTAIRLAVVTDGTDPAARHLLAALERDDSFDVSVFRRRVDGEHEIRMHHVDAAVFDAGLADADELARIRREHRRQPIVAWLASASSREVAALLERAVDEVVHRAMGPDEIAARIAAAARRGKRYGSAPFEVGSLSIDPESGEASWDSTPLRLTPREREVLHVLAESAGTTVPRGRIYKRVWGYTMARGDRSVDVNVKRLRAKLAAAGVTDVEIRTQPGIGYRLEVAAQASEQPLAVTAL